MAKRPVYGWDEQDALTEWRRWYPSMQRAGARSQVKRRYRRKERRQGKAEARGPW